jgi:sec-independent protein translocase protein TatC
LKSGAAMSVSATLKSKLPLKKADDLFDKSSMSFGSHLEELRKCLLYAMIWLCAGVGIGLFFAKHVVNYVQTPLKRSLSEYYANKAKALVEAKSNGLFSEELKQFLIENSMTANFGYLTSAVLAETVPVAPSQSVSQDATATEVAAQDPIADSSSANEMHDQDIGTPGATATGAEAEISGKTPANLVFESQKFAVPQLADLQPYWFIEKTPANTDALGLQEPFMIWLKAGLVVGIVIASPGIFYSMWSFVAAGLYPHERKYVYFFLPCAVLLFLSGAGLAFFVIFEMVIRFLLTFNDSLGIGASPRLSDYMSFALFLPIGFGVAFQLPLVMFVIERLGFISVDTYISQWRIAILIITVISMILTPAEVTSMIGMGVPLVGLYYLGILLCKYFPRRGFQPEVGHDPT